MKTLTRDEWNKLRRHVADNGQRFVLELERHTGATVLTPVEVK